MAAVDNYFLPRYRMRPLKVRWRKALKVRKLSESILLLTRIGLRLPVILSMPPRTAHSLPKKTNRFSSAGVCCLIHKREAVLATTLQKLHPGDDRCRQLAFQSKTPVEKTRCLQRTFIDVEGGDRSRRGESCAVGREESINALAAFRQRN